MANADLVDSKSNVYSMSTWNKLCRACLCIDNELESLFTFKQQISPFSCLADFIVSITALQLSVNDEYPKHICKDCLQQLTDSFYFRQKCHHSFDTLQNIYNQYKRKDLDIENDIKTEILDPLEETNIIFGVEAILDETVFKQNESSYTDKNTLERFEDVKVSKTARLKVCKNTTKNQIKQKEIFEITINQNDDTLLRHSIPRNTKTLNRFVSKTQLVKRSTSLTKKSNIYRKSSNTCSRCKISFQSSAEYNEHVKSHDIFLCPDCGRVCKSYSGYQAHLTSHSNLTPYKCAECGRKYKSQSALHVHKKNHTGERKYKCEHCESKFITWHSMKNHIRTHHLKERNHVCHICAKAFTTSSSLNVHIRQHTGEKPYPCSECDMSFRASGDRKCHMLKHTGVKNFPCSVCDKRFSKPYNLTQHMVTHTGERKHVCTVCGRAFTQAHVLRGHIKTHPEQIQLNSHLDGKT